MVNKLESFIGFTILIGITVITLTGCGSSSDNSSASLISNVPSSSASPDSLTEQEKQSLYFMREEEKLARDVYWKLYDAWGTQTFNSIASSEQTHMDSMLNLLNTYGLEDPAKDAIGEFTNNELQSLYDNLLTQGMGSQLSALWVGALIEETDIQDIVDDMAQIDNADILAVYDNLLCGSRNHLRSYVSQIESKETTYATQIQALEAEVNTILNSPSEQCGQ